MKRSIRIKDGRVYHRRDLLVKLHNALPHSLMHYWIDPIRIEFNTSTWGELIPINRGG